MRPVSHSRKCCVLIDGSYVDRLSKSVRFDFLEFVDFLRSKFQISNLVYFSVVPFYEDEFPKRRLLDWLAYNGFVVKEKVSRKLDSNDAADAGSSLSLDLVVHAFEACVHTDGFVFVSDDSNICAAIFALQRKNKWIALIAAERGSGVGLANDLRRAADFCLPVSSVFGGSSDPKC